ncbi:MAG: glycosyltransferase family 4 protein [Pseudomonadota bacterium]
MGKDDGIDGLPVAFFAPMKSPEHPTPSGDREIARLTLAALAKAGTVPRLVSELRLFDGAGDPAVQDHLARAAAEEARDLIEAKAGGARIWLTYHSHYKAPDLLGPAVTRALGIPYAIVEPSLSPRRREGPWARFAIDNEAAIAAADRLFWTTERDRPALEAAGYGARMSALAPFLDPGAPPPRLGAPAETPLRLLCVAMMRPGDKLESYRRLARGLRRVETACLIDIIGDGPQRAEVEALFAPFGHFGHTVRFHGEAAPATIRAAMEEADLFVWPGVGEGVGLVWLEAQAAGLPVVAENGPAARDIVVAGRLTAPGNAAAFAASVAEAASDRPALSRAAREHILTRHSLDAAAQRLRLEFQALIGGAA